MLYVVTIALKPGHKGALRLDAPVAFRDVLVDKLKMCGGQRLGPLSAP